MVEPFGAGGGPDLVARVIGAKLSELWGQPVTVENHPGDGSAGGPALVAKSAADGYTLLVNTSAQAYSAAFVDDLPYDPLKDFVPVASLTRQPYVLVSGGSSAITTLSELIAAGRAEPGALRFGSTGVGTASHLGAEKFNLEAGMRAQHVPAGPGDSIGDVVENMVSGRTTYIIAPIPLALAGIRARKLRALGVTTKRRSPLLPEVPAIAEAGVAGFDYPIWYGVWVAAGTHAGVVEKIATAIRRVLAAPDVIDELAKHGAGPLSMTQPEFAQFVLNESESAAHIIQAARIKRSNLS